MGASQCTDHYRKCSSEIINTYQERLSHRTEEQEADVSPTSEAKARYTTKGWSSVVRVRGAVHNHIEDIRDMRAFLKSKYTTPLNAWKELFFEEPARSVVKKDDFLWRLSEVGYMGNAERLFNALDDGSGTITYETLRAKLNVSGGKASIGSVVQELMRAKKNTGTAVSDGKVTAEGKAAMKQFRAFLKTKFKSSTESWGALSMGDGKVHRANFIRRCKEMGFVGDLELIFEVMDSEDDGFITVDCFKGALAGQNESKEDAGQPERRGKAKEKRSGSKCRRNVRGVQRINERAVGA